ncbi:I78 family peptidase inhibitor [Tsuneonella sp. YG55]|uniref:I78 family peptidase inhibitor n=1 Tax=Tsuneonella litorea TaxID=2976475 RepID=A0A9X2VZ71_9SPHN|nr:I78 family peptidase inhibitor [Tsuneonella litorea]MCT2558072.1 I78 family peptidase inhibitor [Tsuneonella litorea]
MRAARPALALCIAATMTLSACVTTAADNGGSCHAERVNPWIGHVATPENRADIAKATGAETIRWLYPDSVVTMDYNPARLNVTMDKGTDVIRSAKCG